MGSRLSQPKGPAGTTESSVPTKATPPLARRRFNSRTLVAPAAAATMAILLFVYARTSIRAAKANAQRHREADGGSGLSLLNESRRRHGAERKLEDGGMLRQLADTAKEDLFGREEEEVLAAARSKKQLEPGRIAYSEEERRLRSLTGKGD